MSELQKLLLSLIPEVFFLELRGQHSEGSASQTMSEDDVPYWRDYTVRERGGGNNCIIAQYIETVA